MSIAIYFAVGRIELRVYVLREEQRAMPAYEEPPVLPGGSFSAVSRRNRRALFNVFIFARDFEKMYSILMKNRVE